MAVARLAASSQVRLVYSRMGFDLDPRTPAPEGIEDGMSPSIRLARPVQPAAVSTSQVAALRRRTGLRGCRPTRQYLEGHDGFVALSPLLILRLRYDRNL